MDKYAFIKVYVCIFIDLEYESVLFLHWILVWHKCATLRWQGAVLLLFVVHFRCHQIPTALIKLQMQVHAKNYIDPDWRL